MDFCKTKVDPTQLYSHQEVLNILKEGGATDRDLSKIREVYETRFGNDLIWRFPIMIGDALGAVIVPVQEGFLSIAYNNMNPDDYEIYDLDNQFILSKDDIVNMQKTWKEYSGGLLDAMQEIERILSERE